MGRGKAEGRRPKAKGKSPKAEGRAAKAKAGRNPAVRIRLAAAAIVAAGLWAYANSLSGAFVFDDTPAIVENPHIRTLWPLTRSMSAPPEVTVSGRPIAAFTLALNYAVAALDVGGYHALNLAIHLGAALALFGVVRRTLLSPMMRDRFSQAATPLAFVVALLWPCIRCRPSR